YARSFPHPPSKVSRATDPFGSNSDQPGQCHFSKRRRSPAAAVSALTASASGFEMMLPLSAPQFSVSVRWRLKPLKVPAARKARQGTGKPVWERSVEERQKAWVCKRSVRTSWQSFLAIKHQSAVGHEDAFEIRELPVAAAHRGRAQSQQRPNE